ncbi:OsmC family protein [Neolewinella antarctica]|uniref:Organic hydroperoxide reductase OsmC/OhrA n=1 Tax=Neolewinella antarctica TaxID=442734 RepID=A0ABX0XDZ4_9BACT|nr:OsmC family protein [Neolewinella antarctica]NJC27305.1 organic hydroperoxide reductase OsmC/OhrA [Neolewinella antarctica]
MAGTHKYKVNVAWTGNLGSGTLDYRAYSRDHVIGVEGKEEIDASSDPKFLGDDSRINPEELFLASISSCHMLWYLHLASVNGITVLDYEDDAKGTMKDSIEGGGQFTSVTLRPRITIAQVDKLDRARTLHAEAGKKCFIANSIKVEVAHEGEIIAG